ncbi:MAG TPA: alpha-amylase family glycosyl hydrolase [Ktedonobacterales bacterium]|nr:alpha-amylase family glycosyl hydrolase [Ktedonobacterales bacterium]
MAQILDYFFGAYVTPQEQRLRSVARNGVEHASEISPRDPAPGQEVTLTVVSDASLPIDRVAVYYTTDGSDPLGERGHARVGRVALAELDAVEAQPIGETRVRRWLARLPGQADRTLVRYRIEAWSSMNPAQSWRADVNDPFVAPTPNGREFAYHVDRREAPEWVRDAIVYHIFVDRFASASDQPPLRDLQNLTEFYGGTIRGITEKLDYFSALGVNCLWLSPIMESPTYHSYNPSSYHQVSRRFGTNDDLRELIVAAHVRDMRVMLDFVANHTSNEHPAFLAAQQDPSNQKRSWYTFGPEYHDGYLTFYDVAGMPVLNTDSTPVRDYLIDAARFWLNELGADALRLDNVSGPTQAFWTHFQEGVKATNPDALTLGEISGDAVDIATYAGRLDACMDFPLTKLIRQVFAQRAASLASLLDSLTTDARAFPERMTRACILDNHDMHRFLWLAENDTRRLKLALTFLMVAPGFPVIYYGTEVGLSQREGPPGKDAYAREPMPWGSDQQGDVLEHTRWLIAQRAQRVSLRRGQIAPLAVNVESGDADEVRALARWTDDEATLIIFNNSDQPARYGLAWADLPFASAASWTASATAQAWLLAPDGITPVDAPSLSDALPSNSAMMIVLSPKLLESRQAANSNRKA